MYSTSPSRQGARAFLPLLLVFVIFSAGLFATRSLLTKYNISTDVLQIGNLILFAATAISFYFYHKSIDNNRNNTFITYIYIGMMIKMLLCLFTAFIYIRMAGKEVNKPAVIGCLLIYLIYTLVEVVTLTKLSKQNKNV